MTKHQRVLNELPPIFTAARNGDIQLVNELIKKGFSVNKKTRTGIPPIYAATIEGFYDIVEILLKNGANANELIFNLPQTWVPFDTPLHTAVNNGYLEIVKLLVENGAEINRQIEEGETPLSIAVSRGRVEIVKYLIQKGANAKLKCDNPVLCRAVENVDIQMVKILLELGCDVEQSTFNDLTPLLLATHKNNIQLIQLLAQYKANIKKTTALFIAASKGFADVTKELIILGAEVDMVREDDFTPLYIAVKSCKEEVVKILLEFGKSKSVNILCDNKLSALHIACSRGEFGIANLLLEHGAEVINPAVANLLQFVCKHGTEEASDFAEKLIERGVPVNTDLRSMDGPPLFLAAKNKCIRMLWMLVLAGADGTQKKYWHMKLVKDIHKDPQMSRVFNLVWNPHDFKYMPKWMKAVIKCVILVLKRISPFFDSSIIQLILSYVIGGWCLTSDNATTIKTMMNFFYVKYRWYREAESW